MDNDNAGLDAGANAGPDAGAHADWGALPPRRERTEWHRRLALGLSAQLPDNAEDARAVVECVEELVETFLYPRPAAGGPAGQDRVLLFAAAPPGISSCRTR